MNKYAEVAIKATNLLSTKILPVEAWEIAAKDVFPNSKSSQKKSCPKSTFLGLCEDELIKDSVCGIYTRSKLNKGYALKSLKLLQADSSLSTDINKLWCLVAQNKKSNNQMDVVTALWDNNLINKERIIK